MPVLLQPNQPNTHVAGGAILTNNEYQSQARLNKLGSKRSRRRFDGGDFDWERLHPPRSLRSLATMRDIVLPALLAVSISGCDNPNSPRAGTLSMVAETAAYSQSSSGAYASVRIDLRIRNESDDPLWVDSVCGFAMERNMGPPNGFVSVAGSACGDFYPPLEVEPHADTLLRFTRLVETRFVDESAEYRASLVASFGRKPGTMSPHKSAPFSLVSEHETSL